MTRGHILSSRCDAYAILHYAHKPRWNNIIETFECRYSLSRFTRYVSTDIMHGIHAINGKIQNNRFLNFKFYIICYVIISLHLKFTFVLTYHGIQTQLHLLTIGSRTHRSVTFRFRNGQQREADPVEDQCGNFPP